MYNHEPKGYACPLCQIVKGQETNYGSQEDAVVFRNKYLTVFVAGKWWKTNLGHIVITTNKHIENIYDMPEDIGHIIFDMSKRVAIALKQAYKCDGVSTRQHNEPAGNQDVYHFHLHVFPRYKDDNLYINNNETYWPTPDEKKPYVEKLKPYFKNI